MVGTFCTCTVWMHMLDQKSWTNEHIDRWTLFRKYTWQKITVRIAGISATITTDIVNCNIHYFLAMTLWKKLKHNDFQGKNHKIDAKFTSTGPHSVELCNKFRNENKFKSNISLLCYNLNILTPLEKYKTALKLHRQCSHSSSNRLHSASKDFSLKIWKKRICIKVIGQKNLQILWVHKM